MGETFHPLESTEGVEARNRLCGGEAGGLYGRVVTDAS